MATKRKTEKLPEITQALDILATGNTTCPVEIEDPITVQNKDLRRQNDVHRAILKELVGETFNPPKTKGEVDAMGGDYAHGTVNDLRRFVSQALKHKAAESMALQMICEYVLQEDPSDLIATDKARMIIQAFEKARIHEIILRKVTTEIMGDGEPPMLTAEARGAALVRKNKALTATVTAAVNEVKARDSKKDYVVREQVAAVDQNLLMAAIRSRLKETRISNDVDVFLASLLEG